MFVEGVHFGEREGRASGSGFRKVLLCFFFNICANVENCGSFKSFGFICVGLDPAKSHVLRFIFFFLAPFLL